MSNSISSKVITNITINRNPHGKESNWIDDLANKFQQCPDKKTIKKAEICYAITTVIALVETVASTFFIAATLPYALVNQKPLKKSCKRLKSSSFSIIWSFAYLYYNMKSPHLLSREDYARNHIFRGFYNNYHKHPKAPITSRSFMMLRAMPKYLSTAYDVYYKDQDIRSPISLRGKIKRYKKLIKNELFQKYYLKTAIKQNSKKLDNYFTDLNNDKYTDKKFFCAYFVSGQDHNGAVLGKLAYYYHHYKIKNLQKHYNVSAKIVNSTKEIFDHLSELKQNFPDQPVKVVDIVAHGSAQSINIGEATKNNETTNHEYNNDNVDENEFQNCASDATIIIDACLTGSGKDSIANKIAEKNPGKKVFAPTVPLFFSKPNFKATREGIVINHVTHGFAFFNAYTAKKFQATPV